MNEAVPREIATIGSYHAHVYYDPVVTRGIAERLRARVADRFEVQLGRWHDRLVGPHTRSMFQIAFRKAEFATLVPWLMLNRDGLAVLVHPNTENPRRDHLVHALWLGEVLDIRGDLLPEQASDPDPDRVVPNTQPTLGP